jgi:hypothetical protein
MFLKLDLQVVVCHVDRLRMQHDKEKRDMEELRQQASAGRQSFCILDRKAKCRPHEMLPNRVDSRDY